MAEGRKPPIPKGWEYDSPWDDVVIEGDGQVSGIWGLPTAVSGINQFGNSLMDSASVNPATWPGWLLGATMDGLTDAPNKYLQGDDVTMGDAGLFAAEAIPGVLGAGKVAVKGAQNLFGHLALPQDITRMIHAHDTKRLTGKEKAKAAKNKGTIADQVLEAAVPLYSSVKPTQRKGWYQGGKPEELARMAKNSIVDPIKRLYDPWADSLYRKYGISDSQRKAFEDAFKWEDGYYNAQGQKVVNPRQATNKNEYISNAQYIESMLEKYFPGNNKFKHEMRQLLFPKTVTTTGSAMAESALPIKQVIGSTFGRTADELSDADILTHISRPMVGKHKLGDKRVILNSRRWSEDSPIKSMAGKSSRHDRVKTLSERSYHGTSGKYNAATTAHYVMRGMPEGPVDMDDILGAIRKHNDEVRTKAVKIQDDAYKTSLNKKGVRKRNFKRLFDNKVDRGLKSLYGNNPLIKIDELYKGMEETDRFVSFDGRILGEDRLLANYNHRLIIDKTNGDMFMLTFDEMRLGSGNSTLDTIVNASTPESMMVDVTPIIRKPGGRTTAGDSVATGQIGLDKKDWAQEVRSGVEDMLGEHTPVNYNPLARRNLGNTAKFAAKAAGIHGTGAVAYGLLNED